MKSPITIISLFLFSWVSITAQAGETEIIHQEEMSFPGQMRSPKIPAAIGDFFQFPSSCAKEPHQLIRADRFVFPNASIGKIDSCTFTYIVIEDTIRQWIISLPSALSIKQAGKQASKQYGKPAYHKESNRYVYVWKVSPRQKNRYTVQLEVNAELTSGMMYGIADE